MEAHECTEASVKPLVGYMVQGSQPVAAKEVAQRCGGK